MNFKNILLVLSSNSEKQIQYLKGIGVYPSLDELALEFDDGFSLFMRNYPLDYDTKQLLNFLNEKFEIMSDNKKIWKAESLDNED